MSTLIKQAYEVARDPRASKWLVPLQLAGETALCCLIVWKVPYTKIDWDAYMQQVEQFIAGERDYVKITGETGPLVYPAVHVYIYRFLHAITDSGRDIRAAQYLFVGLYLATLLLVMQCYRVAKVPPYIFPLLSLSKRVHSIFMLRLFNDCFAVAFLFLSIYCWQKRSWTLGTIMFSLGLGVKMSLLLALPAVGMVLWQGMGRNRALRQALSIWQIQVLIAMPFATTSLPNYASRAFEFTRQFMFKWTVNWRFVGEERFLSRAFSVTLLATHATLLGVFGVSRWLEPSGLTITGALHQLIKPPSPEVQSSIARRVTSRFILTSILSAVTIGCLCARSLHYQFFVYIAWSTPVLLWHSGLHPVLVYAVCVAQEWAWNVYPSTDISSAVVVGCLALTAIGSWIGQRRDSATAREGGEVASSRPHAH